SPFANRRQPSSMVHRSGGRSFGRVVIPAFGGQGPRISAFADTLQEMLQRLAAAQPCGWIVDLRGNGGGNMWPMLAGVGPLLGETEDAGRFRSLDGDVRWYYGRGAAGTIAGDGAREEAARISGTPLPALRGAVAVLTDRGTASSGEALAIAFRGRSDTRSFGEATYGVPTANQGFRLSDGANIVLTVAIEVDRTGQEFDREIVPDEPIAAEGQPDRPEQDPVSTRAISWLAATPDCRR
ncbi:MAG TPA: S41 family peptidase, partial [Vicinamibacterales bacterium]|nr:S41 family peptidase [Vicinamibacterales bacterium]